MQVLAVLHMPGENYDKILDITFLDLMQDYSCHEHISILVLLTITKCSDTLDGIDGNNEVL